MKDKKHKVEFANRLRSLMIQRGYASHNATSGVSPSALAKAIGCFNEMALRYLDGRSIPNPESILKISEWLQVEPGYLLFGDQGFKPSNEKEENYLKIDKDFLHYTLIKITAFLKEISRHNEEDFLDFYLNVLIELSNMDIQSNDLKKVFDLTMKSVLTSQDNGKSKDKILSKITS